MRKIYVFGHRRPDTDAVCGAISLSYLKNKIGLNTEPRILSEINAETEYVLKKFKISVPKYLNDTKTQLKDINYHRDYFVNENDSIFSVYNFIQTNELTGIPLVNDNNHFTGYVSLREITKELTSNNHCKLNTTLKNIIVTLNAKESYNFENNVIGNPVLVSVPFRLFIKTTDINETSVVILTNTEYILDYAIEKKVKLIIITDGKKLNKEQINLIKKHNINVIITPYDVFKVSRILALSNPTKTIKRISETICFEPLDYLSDFLETSNKLKHTNYPIVNGRGVCEGLLRVTDTNNFIKKQVILVDHNDPAQSVDGLNEAEIIEIVDHHNIGNINTTNPINFRNMLVGSVNTIIYNMFLEQKVSIPTNIASIMLSGILSDTLLLASPTTTDEDRKVVEALAKITKLNIKEYGLELLKSGVSIEGLSINEVINKDFKNYMIGEIKIGVAQVFTTSFKEYQEKLSEYVNELNQISNNANYRVVCLLITDIINNSSHVIFNDSAKKYLEDAFNINDIYQGYLLGEVVSRKQQIVPLIMQVFEK